MTEGVQLSYDEVILSIAFFEASERFITMVYFLRAASL